jgi:UDP-glucuronate 4-epimerase
MKVLVTGNAGFIGHHVARTLMERGDSVVGIDVVNDYYDTRLKEARLADLAETAARTGAEYHFIRADLADGEVVRSCFAGHRFDRVIHLAAQAGVRYSLENPQAYVESNITAFTHVLEACRRHAAPHLTFASTSSVYGANAAKPSSEHHGADHPLQFYAATKRANELMAHAYSHLFALPVTALRFFTVYGPWGRPDMAPWLFTKNISEGKPIRLFNHGRHSRDFTFISDIVDGVIRASDAIAGPSPGWNAMQPDPQCSAAPYRLFNIGNGQPVELADFIAAIEENVGRKAIIEMLPLQPGDVADSFADVSEISRAVGYSPRISYREGVKSFVDWFREFHR